MRDKAAGNITSLWLLCCSETVTDGVHVQAFTQPSRVDGCGGVPLAVWPVLSQGV